MSIGKQQIIEKIANSSKGIWILGIANLDLDLAEDRYEQYSIFDILYKKFTGLKDYEISIITESMPQLSKISQTSYFNTSKSGTRNLSLLMEKKNSFEGIRRVLENCSNIEPTEHVCNDELNLVFNKHLIENIISEMATMSRKKVKQVVATICELYSKKLTSAVEEDFRKAPQYTNLVKNRQFAALGKVETSFESELAISLRNSLGECDTVDMLINQVQSQQEIAFDVEIDGVKVTFRTKIKLKKKIEMLVNCVLSNLYQSSPTSYKQIRDNAAYKATLVREQALQELCGNPKYKQRLWVKNFCDDIYQQVLKIDDEYYVVNDNMEFVPTSDSFVIDYFAACLASNNVAEITQKGNKAEVVPCYIYVTPSSKDAASCNRYNVGQRARDAFYYEEHESMQFIKNVAWALVFDRQGNVLLHKRGMNAKDNQDMWDKSVGGHIGINDPNAIYGARREIIEELYTIEGEEQSHVSSENSLSKPDPERIIFLGQWDEKRYPKFKEFLSDGSSLKLEDNEYYCFKFECPLTVNVVKSKRKLPSGKTLYAKCFVDLFFVIVSKNFDLSKLQNSEYLCVPPVKVQEFRRAGRITRQDGSVERFDVTPDLDDLLSNPVWDNEVTIFAKSVGDAFGK